MNDAPRHLVAVWNPAYAEDALDEHLRVLLDWSERHRQGKANEDEVYVWWARIRSQNRTEPLPHMAEVLRLQDQIDGGVETHLYLTDYRSLFVAHVEEVTAEPVMQDTPGEWDHVPHYLRGHTAELWFRLLDIRRLVAGDTLEVIAQLKRLRNTRYHDKPVSLYGGMVELPLIVCREPPVSWFDAERALTGGRLWAERDAEFRGEIERLERDLRDNLFGLPIWGIFESSTRSFAATGEAVYRMRREDLTFDLSAALIEYAKALETELNALLFPAVARALAHVPTSERITQIDGRPTDLAGRVAHQTLGALATLLEHDDVLRRGLKQALPSDWKWLTGELPGHLAPILAARNPGAHSRAQSRDTVQPLRNAILGIGCEGLLVRVARIRMRAG